jgi:uncharacterized protein YodC (DUF2158 family)
MKFSLGDVVVLASGGPEMTVAHVDKDGVCTVLWFTVEDSLRRDSFPEHVLILSETKRT